MRHEIKGILFDKDGTLFDFQTSWAPVFRALLARLAEGPEHAGQLAGVLGYDTATGTIAPGSVVIAGSTADIAAELLPLLPRWQARPLEDFLNSGAGAEALSPVTDIPALVLRLKSAGLAVGVATNDAVASAHAHLAHAGAAGMFDFVAGYDSGHGAKPAPGMIHAFCAHVGLAPATVAMIGDSTHDLVAARAAGAVAVGVLTGVAGRDALAPHADLVLDSIRDLPHWLGVAA